MTRALRVLLIIAAPALFAADPAITFTPTEVVIAVTPGASLAYATTSGGSLHSELVRVVTDTDADGIIRVARTTSPGLTRHAVLVADVSTGAFAYATEGVAPVLQPLPLGTILRGPTGAFTQIALPYAGMEIVWVRPGVSSWVKTVDPAGNAGFVRGYALPEPKDFRLMAGAPATPIPGSFQRGDVLLVLDRAQKALAGSVNANLDDTTPGVVAFFVDGTGNTEGQSFTVKLWRLGNTSGAAAVRVQLTGDAVEGVHFQSYDPIVRFAPGEMFRELTIGTVDDQVWSGSVPFALNLIEPENATVGAKATIPGSIHDNDPTPTLGLASTPADVTETDGPSVLTLTITKRNATRVAATVTVEWTISRAFPSETRGELEVALAPDEMQKTFDIPLPGNVRFDGTREIEVELDNARGATIRFEESRRTIQLRDDELPQVAASGFVVQEGFHQLILGAQLEAVTTIDRPVTLTWRTVDGTAKAGSDYTALSGTIPNFQADTPIGIATRQDEEIEGDEVFYIEIVSATNAEITRARAAVTIRDNSYPEVRIGSPAVVEGGPGARTNAVVRLTFSRTTVIPSVLSLVRSRELYSAAAAGRDYDPVWEGVPVYVPPGQSGVDVIIPVLGDAESEGSEELFLQTGLLLGFRGTQSGRLTIQDDDPGAAVTHVYLSGGGGADEGPNGRALFGVGTFARKSGPLSVSWRTEDGTAAAGTDYVAASGTLEFGTFDSNKQISVQLIDDGDDENDETFFVVLHTPAGATIDDIRSRATIRDNDLPAAPPPVLEVNDITAGEKDGAAVFTLTLSAAWPVPVIVEYETVPPAQFPPGDFVPVAGSVTFAPGERTRTVTVPILDDPFHDPGETFRLRLSSGMASVPRPLVVCTIDDDEPVPEHRASRH